VPLACHTLRHCGVAVRGREGWLLHAGDAYFFHDEMALGRYSGMPLLRAYQRLTAAHNESRLVNQTRLRELKRSHGREIQLLSAGAPGGARRQQQSRQPGCDRQPCGHHRPCRRRPPAALDGAAFRGWPKQISRR
jgi:hypothetical protein